MLHPRAEEGMVQFVWSYQLVGICTQGMLNEGANAMKEVSERGEGLENLIPQNLQELFGQWRKHPLDLAETIYY